MKKTAKWLKKYFIPHQENGHKPHFLRLKTSLIILSVVLFLEILLLVQIFVLFPNVKFFASVLPSVLVDLTNRDRQNNNNAPLTVSPVLEKAAALKAQDMASKGYFAHTSPEGKTPWYWFDQVGYKYIYAGENLAVNFVDSTDIETAWMNSTGHRENIESSNYTQIGIATAQGIYEGRETIFVVQLFGKPVGASVITTASAPKPTAQKPIAVVSQSPKQTASSAAEKVESVSETAEQNNLGATENQNAENSNPTESAVNNAPTTAVKNSSSFLTRVISTPRSIVNFLYLVLATIVVLALILTIFVKFNIQHPHIIINGVVLLLIIGSVLAVNQYALLFLGQVN